MLTKKRFMALGMTAAVAAGVAFMPSAANALPVFYNDSNKLIGDPRNGTDEDYFTGGLISYTTPDGVAAAGSTPGHIESLRLGGGGSVGINVPQPALIVNPADPRAPFSSTLFTGTATDYGWGVRAGAAVQWQTLQNGASVALTPLGMVTGQAYNLTPGTLAGVVTGFNADGTFNLGLVPADVGGAPGSMPVDGLADFVPWLRTTPVSTTLVTGFDINFLDTATVSAAFPGDAAALAALVGRFDVFEDLTLYGQVLGGHNEDNFNHNGGSFGFLGDQLNNAVDGTLLLTGTLENVIASTTWTATFSALVDPDGIPGSGDEYFVAAPGTVRRSVSVTGEVHFDGGTLFPELASTIGFFKASWTGIPFTNTTGTDSFGAATNGYDFRGDALTSYSGDLTFIMGNPIPEPMTAGLGLLALGALTGYTTRRRKA